MTQQIYSHTFSNGLVLLAEAMNSLESAAFTFALPAGSIYESRREAGLATFTCEMSTRGAGDRDNRRFVNDLDNLGIDRSESVSGAHTFYTGATLAKNLDDALAIYADMILRPRLPEDQFDACRQILLQELKAIEDDPGHKVMMELRERHYPTPWGYPSEGTRDGVMAITPESVRKFYQSFFRPNGTILSVAGCIDWPKLKESVGRLFSDWKPLEVRPIQEGKRGSRREHIQQDTNQTQIGVAYDSLPYRHPDYFQAWGAVGVLSGGMSSRLFTEVREKRGLCYSVYAHMHTLKDRGAVICYSGTGSDRAQETLDVMVAELHRLAEGVYSEELNRLKARMKSSLIMQQESSSARSSAMTRDWYHLGTVRTLDELGSMVDGLTAESISAYLAKNPPGDFTIVTLGPEPLEAPN